MKLKVRDYTEYPGNRNITQGINSGEDYYNTVLKQALMECIKSEEKLIIDLDNTRGYAYSFLDECFGRMTIDFKYKDIKKTISIISKQETDWIDIILKEILPKWRKRKITNKTK